MYIEPISALVEFFAQGRRSADDLCRFLIFETFQMFNPTSIFVGEIASSGFLIHKVSFGIEKKELNKWVSLSLNLDTPITKVAMTNKCMILNSPKELYANHPMANELEAGDVEWQSCIAVPVLPHGAYFLFTNKKPKKDLEFEHFLRAVGQLMMMHLNRGPALKKDSKASLEGNELTQRQKIIFSFVEKGFTNSQIATEIGYSESLVRHETIEIYSKLNVSGRKDLIQNSGGGG
jgi:DNA-binding CsgD family transcriptional regulator